MILIEFEGGKAKRFHMEFHPLVTVVKGFNEAQRRDLSTRIQAAMTGANTGFRFNVDIGGQVHVLDDAAVDKLNIRNVKLDNVMRAAHLPGVKFNPARQQAANEAVMNELQNAQAELEKAQQRLQETETALERALNPRSPVESSVVEQLVAAHEKARALVGELRIKLDSLPLDDTSEERDRRIVRLEIIAQAIRDRIKELRVLIDRLQPPPAPAELSPSHTAVELANAWIDVETRIAEEDSKPPLAPRWLIESTRADLEAARERVEELKANNEVFALQQAQQELLDAQEVWSEIERGATDAELLREERAFIFSEAVALIGREVDTIDLLDALRSLPATQVAAEPPNPERDRLQRDLAAAILDHQDVLHEIRELRSVDIAEATDEERELRAQLTNELDEAELREAELGERLAELQVAARRVPLVNPSMIAIVTDERDRAFVAFSNATQTVERLTQAAASQNELVSEPPLDDLSDSQLDFNNVQQDQVEVFVMSRVAWLRQSANGESLPLIVDAAFDGLPVALQLRLLNLLGSVASTVQVVYLASSSTAIDWAERQSEMLAAVVQLERLS